MLTHRRPIVVKPVDSPSPTSSLFAPPDFTIKDLLGSIPTHCFERSALKSSQYLLADLVGIGALVWAASWIDVLFGPSGAWISGPTGVAAKWIAWSTYWVANGLVMTGGEWWVQESRDAADDLPNPFPRQSLGHR